MAFFKPTKPVKPLLFAAAWNILGATSALVEPVRHFAMFYRPAFSLDPLLMVSHHTLWTFILVMGVCNAIAAYDRQYRPGILLVGVIGKCTALIVWTLAYLQGVGTPMLVVAGLGDLAWAVYFVTVLRRMHRDDALSAAV